MSDDGNLVVKFVLMGIVALVVLFVVLGIVLAPTAQTTIEEQQKFIDTFSPLGLSGQGTMKLECTPKSNFYEYKGSMDIELPPPEENLNDDEEKSDLPFVVIAFLDDNTFALGSRGTTSVINYPSELKATLSYMFESKKLKKNGVHVTFWKPEKCIDKYMERKQKSFLGIVGSCAADYLYGGFLTLSEKNVDNSQCICDEKASPSSCATQELCYYNDGECKNCDFFSKCEDLGKEQCNGCKFAKDNCLWNDDFDGGCQLNPRSVKAGIEKIEAKEDGGQCEIRFKIKNTGSVDWIQEDRAKVIINCNKKLYIPYQNFAYIELDRGEDVEVSGECLKPADCTAQTESECDKDNCNWDGSECKPKEWSVNLYMKCDDSKTDCGADAEMVKSLSFTCDKNE